MKPIAKAGIGCLIIFLTCLGGIGFVVYRISNGAINPSHDYAGDIEQLVADAQPARRAQPPRWSELMSLISRSQEIHARHAALGSADPADALDTSILRDPLAAQKPARRKAALALVAEMKEQRLFARMQDLVRTGSYVRPLEKHKWLIETLLPDLGHARQFARAAASQLRLSAQAGNYSDYLEAAEAGLGMGQIYTHQGILIERLVGTAIFALVLETIREDMVEHQFPAETSEALAQLLDRYCTVPPIELSIKSERLSVHDSIQWTFSDDGHGNGFLLPSALRSINGGAGNPQTNPLEIFGNFGGVALADRADTAAKVDRYFEQTVSYSRLGYQQRINHPFQPDRYVEQLGRRDLLLKIILPALGRAISSSDQLDLQVQSTRIMVAIERHRAAHAGAPPAALAELAPTYLAAIPKDPISGKDFGYRLNDAAADQAKRPYLLWSFGADATDDNAKQPPIAQNRIIALNRSGGIGFDYIINEPPPPAKPQK